MARTKQFKAESKKLLDMMINSIYTHKEIFLRELISNASDAMDKLYFLSLTDDNIKLNRDDFRVKISLDKANRTITITDNGIGMSGEELETNLGTIAKSGSFNFKQENEKQDDIDIIGQFGVGFYSAFMVSKKWLQKALNTAKTLHTAGKVKVRKVTALKNVTKLMQAQKSHFTSKTILKKKTMMNIWNSTQSRE